MQKSHLQIENINKSLANKMLYINIDLFDSTAISQLLSFVYAEKKVVQIKQIIECQQKGISFAIFFGFIPKSFPFHTKGASLSLEVAVPATDEKKICINNLPSRMFRVENDTLPKRAACVLA